MKILAGARSALAILLVCAWLVAGGLFQRLLVWPAWLLLRSRRQAIVSWYFRGMSRVILWLCSGAGARYRRTGTLPTAEPILVVMNHQSLLDICTVGLISAPYVPAFVIRRRYTRFIPAISLCQRLLQCPVVDPQRDPRAAVAAIEEAARGSKQSLLIYPEGHRSKDGEIRPFKTAGTEAMLRARRSPVYLVVTDGFSVSRRLVDFLFNIGNIRGETEVLGPFDPPAPGAEAAFVARIRGIMVEHQKEMRRRHAAA